MKRKQVFRRLEQLRRASRELEGRYLNTVMNSTSWTPDACYSASSFVALLHSEIEQTLEGVARDSVLRASQHTQRFDVHPILLNAVSYFRGEVAARMHHLLDFVPARPSLAADAVALTKRGIGEALGFGTSRASRRTMGRGSTTSPTSSIHSVFRCWRMSTIALLEPEDSQQSVPCRRPRVMSFESSYGFEAPSSTVATARRRRLSNLTRQSTCETRRNTPSRPLWKSARHWSSAGRRGRRLAVTSSGRVRGRLVRHP